MSVDASYDAVVIGAGPGGLGTLRELRRRGLSAVALERAPELAPTWRGAYDRVHLNTAACLSHLPGRRIPRSAGRWPSRDAYLAYLEDYVEAEGLDVRLEVDVRVLERDGDGWTLDTSAGEVRAAQVVVATGYSARPRIPAWPGRDAFGGEVLHASAYRNGAPWAGRTVLVAGSGNSGAEIAVDLVEHGAAAVRLAVRTPPHVVVREVAGIPNQVLAVGMRRLPSWAGDRLIAAGARLALGDLRRAGLPAPPEGALTRARRDGAIPVVDSGFAAALRAGAVEVVPAVEALGPGGARLADGRVVAADAVIAATGYATGLEALVGGLGVLDARGLPLVHGARTSPAAPGLRFVGFTNPISGNLREMRLDARRVARAAEADLLRAPRPRRRTSGRMAEAVA